MANVFTPTGFNWLKSITAVSPNYTSVVRKIAASDTTQIFRGDPVQSLATGYIQKAPVGSSGTPTVVGGIFVGCEYLSISIGRVIWSPFWPGSDAAQDVTAYIINSPDAVFAVQSGNGGPVPFDAIGSNVNFALGTGNTKNGRSGAYVDFATIAADAWLPFRIVEVGGDVNASPIIVGNGSDITTEYNMVYVTFNNMDFKSTTGV